MLEKPGELEFIRIDGDFGCFLVSTNIYELQAFLKAAYKFTDRSYIHIEFASETNYRVRIKSKKATGDIQSLAGEFCNELIDQTLRISIARETEPVRNLILANAFSKTALIEAELEIADYTLDPRRISEPDGNITSST
jgi:His-Xaa-Ser system protein HxsD